MRRSIKWCVGCLVLGLLAVASQSAFAQGGPPSGGRGGFGMFGGGQAAGLMLLMNPKVQEELDLVDDQIEDLKSLQEEMQTAMREMFSGMRDMDPEERRTAMEEMRGKMEKKAEEFQAEVDEVLLPHQSKRLKQLAFQTQNRVVGGFGGRGGLSDALKEELDITSEQEEKMQSAAEKAQEEMQAEMRKLQSRMEEKVLKELTDEQRKKYKELTGEPFDFGQMFGRGGGFGFGGPGGGGPGGGGRGGQGGNQGGSRGGRSDF